MEAVVASFNLEKALVGAFSVIVEKHLGPSFPALILTCVGCRDLIRSCLTVCPQQRPSLAKLLRHPWLEAEAGDLEVDSGVESGDGDSWAETSAEQDNADTLGKLKLSGSSLESL